MSGNLPPRLEPELHDGKTWSLDHSCVLRAQHCAWLIVENFKWASGRILGECLYEVTESVSKLCPSQWAVKGQVVLA